MQPYYEDDLVTLYHGDCMELADLWTCADVLVSDPPYGIAYVSNFSKLGRSAPIAGDSDSAKRDWMLELWGDRPALVFGTWRVARPAGVRQLVVWDKGNTPSLGDLKIPWGPSHEEVYVLGSGFVGKRSGSVVRVNMLSGSSKDRPNHPTPKPVALMETLIAKCPPGVVADPFAGSGSTLVAAKALGRKAIGVELEEKYCEVSAKRLAQDVLDLSGWST